MFKSLMSQIFTFSEQILSRGSVGESRDDGLFSDSTSGGDGRAAQTGQVVAIAMNDFLDETELAQAPKLARDAGRRDLAQGTGEQARQPPHPRRHAPSRRHSRAMSRVRVARRRQRAALLALCALLALAGCAPQPRRAELPADWQALIDALGVR